MAAKNRLSAFYYPGPVFYFFKKIIARAVAHKKIMHNRTPSLVPFTPKWHVGQQRAPSLICRSLAISLMPPHLHDFVLHCPSPSDLGASSRVSLLASSFCNRSYLTSDVANPLPASSHQDGNHWFSSTPFKEIFI